MGFLRIAPFVTISLMVSACARPAEIGRVEWFTPPGLALEPLEYGEQCAAARQLARDSASSLSIIPPKPLRMMIPPMPVPMNVRRQSAVVTIRVDSAGKYAPADLTVTGLSNKDYQDRVRRGLLTMLEFYPAHIGKCAVNGVSQLVFEF